MKDKSRRWSRMKGFFFPLKHHALQTKETLHLQTAFKNNTPAFPFKGHESLCNQAHVIFVLF